MEAPDKIYLQRNTTTDLYGEFWPEWFEDTNHPDSDICYIRKDAVLELLQKRNKEINGESKALFRSQELQEIYWRIKEL